MMVAVFERLLRQEGVMREVVDSVFRKCREGRVMARNVAGVLVIIGGFGLIAYAMYLTQSKDPAFAGIGLFAFALFYPWAQKGE